MKWCTDYTFFEVSFASTKSLCAYEISHCWNSVQRIHCGCIVSAPAFMLLDAGGIECLTCARKKVSVVRKDFTFLFPIIEFHPYIILGRLISPESIWFMMFSNSR